MSSLTSEELTSLTKSVNERLAEFGPDTLGCLSVGVVRLVVDVIAAWEAAENMPNADLAWQIEQGKSTLPLMLNGNVSHAVVDDDLDDDFDHDLDDLDEEAPKPKMTDARRRQLDGYKRERKRKMNYEQEVSAGRKGNVLPTLEEIVAELQRLSMGTGIMPTMATFDAARPGNWATAGAHMQRLNMSWIDLANEAELRSASAQDNQHNDIYPFD